MNINTDDIERKTGAQLLEEWKCNTREEKLERAVMALMENLETNHQAATGQSLADNLNNDDVFCSCADAYRMGHEALKRLS